jgi:hypothetical protein
VSGEDQKKARGKKKAGQRGKEGGEERRTLLLVDSHDDDNLVPSNPDQLLNGPNAPPREFGKKNHALDVVVFELLRSNRSAPGVG